MRNSSLFCNGIFSSICMAALFVGAVRAETASEHQSGYGIHAGDILQIFVWEEPALNLEVLVQPDGRFSFPLVGAISAAGRTTEQIQQQITNRIKNYITEPVVVVGIKQIQGNKIYVVGKVNRPGEFIMNHEINVMQALSMAGGATAFASLNSIMILRQVKDKRVAIPFRYGDVADGSKLEQNITLQSGDVVVVP